MTKWRGLNEAGIDPKRNDWVPDKEAVFKSPPEGRYVHFIQFL